MTVGKMSDGSPCRVNWSDSTWAEQPFETDSLAVWAPYLFTPTIKFLAIGLVIEDGVRKIFTLGVGKLNCLVLCTLHLNATGGYFRFL
jgi:hypothetical protein